jgi:hypothetical protein
MKWRLSDRRGKVIATGTVEQMYDYLKSLLPDGEYQLVGSEISLPVRRYQGSIVYPKGLEEFISGLASRNRS